jgi:hypothetical protein
VASEKGPGNQSITAALHQETFMSALRQRSASTTRKVAGVTKIIPAWLDSADLSDNLSNRTAMAAAAMQELRC